MKVYRMLNQELRIVILQKIVIYFIWKNRIWLNIPYVRIHIISLLLLLNLPRAEDSLKNYQENVIKKKFRYPYSFGSYQGIYYKWLIWIPGICMFCINTLVCSVSEQWNSPFQLPTMQMLRHHLKDISKLWVREWFEKKISLKLHKRG